LDLARDLAEEGDSGGAASAYRAYLESGAPAERAEALIELAEVLIAAGEGASAAPYLDTYLFEAAPGANVRDAQFMLAESLSARSDWSGALALYDAYLRTSGAATPYASIGRAEALAWLGRGPEAERSAEALLSTDLPAPAKAALMRSLAEAFEAGDDVGRALAWYERLAVEGGPSDQALALWQSAVLKIQTGDQSWRSDIAQIIQGYPATSSARQAVRAFFDLRGQIDDYYFGLVYYQHGEDDSARPILEGVVAEGPSPNSARAAYYLAAIDERAGETDAAIAGYARVLEIDPSIELADDALWWRGRLLEQTGADDQAAADYRRLASEFGSSDRGREARFRLALLEYDAGRYQEAAAAYAELAADTTGEQRKRALLWRGKSLAANGQQDEANAVWQTLSQEGASGFYSLRAAVHSGNATGQVDDGDVDTNEATTEWSMIEEWLNVGGTAKPATGAAAANGHFRTGRELSSLGLVSEADAEFELALFAAAGDRHAILDLARRFDTLDLPHLSSRAATRLLDSAGDDEAQNAPDDLWRLAYPTPFADELFAATESSDVPPLLLLSMVRQESFFNPRAGSPAGALGLTQVIEPTGEAIAEDLGYSEFELEDLYQPSLSLQFGAHYLREQLDAFDGNVYHALAAYNGGPGNAQRWADEADGDADRFYEEIDFSESRLYVELVGENLARYRQLYGGLQEPALPED
jgi:soluble lytic murein transglycosylase